MNTTHNNTVNWTSSEEKAIYQSDTTATLLLTSSRPKAVTKEFLIFVKLVCIMVFFLGLIGNSLVIFVFGGRWSKLKTYEIFMFSLAIADLVATIIVPMRMFLELMKLDIYMIGNTGCKILSSLTVTTITVSALTLLVISIDRFIIVKWPFRKAPESWQINVIVLTIWLLALGMSSIYWLGNRIRVWKNSFVDTSYYVCRSFMSRKETTSYVILLFSTQIIIPLTVMTILYVLIVRLLREATVRNDLFLCQPKQTQARLLRNQKATILFITIVTAYYIFVLPGNIFFLLYVFDEVNLEDNELLTVHTLLQMIMMLNSCVNPIVYAKLHTVFRRSTLKRFYSFVATKAFLGS